MSIIIPSILTPSRADVVEKLNRLRDIADTVQIDVVDGHFAAPATWPYTEGSGELARLSAEEGGLHALGSFRYEVDLMIKDPEESAGAWVTAGATRVVIHVESTQFLARLIDDFEKRYGHDKNFAPDLLSVGLSLSLDTDTAAVEPFLSRIDYVQFMGIKTIGSQGQHFEERVLAKIRAFKKAHPDMPVQVDGGVSLTTAPALLAAGVNRLVVGSALWKSDDVVAELARFEQLAEQYGTYA